MVADDLHGPSDGHRQWSTMRFDHHHYQKFNMAHSTVYRLWECMVCMFAMGVIICPELNSQKQFQEATNLSNRACSRGCQESATKEEWNPCTSWYKIESSHFFFRREEQFIIFIHNF